HREKGIRRPGGRPGPVSGAPAEPPTCTASSPAPGKQAQGTAPLTLSPPRTVTTHTPGGRQNSR
ncbi:hypothetical protein O4U47_18405, partial [Nocardiopsis sp. LSu2-4]|nr:hypothetical protein [Nocardiopsis suaedae]